MPLKFWCIYGWFPNTNCFYFCFQECRKSFGICLIESDLVYLLENGYESKIINRFIKVNMLSKANPVYFLLRNYKPD